MPASAGGRAGIARTPRSAMPTRLLTLLTLLQTRPRWSATDLCSRLEITGRTLRRDIERLRGLDYPIESVTGRAGGYRLTAGRNLPPLVLDNEEAVAISVALGGLGAQLPALSDGVERVQLKLDQLLPAGLRDRVSALRDSVAAPAIAPRPEVDPELLIMIGRCCRDHQVLAFDYAGRSRAGAQRRRTEPHQLIMLRGYWYLVAHDQDRRDWRTFRLDRISLARAAHDHFAARQLDVANFIRERFSQAEYAHTAQLRVGASADRVRSRIWGTLPGAVTATDDDHCEVRLSADSVDLVVQYAAVVLALDVPVELIASGPVADRLRGLSAKVL
ncbi:helix-turn-helix transcriptional regulator [Microlunatus soli]|uniref:Predicted DNA-binding transcriptional regulator YafY, contains an HTH and WYL domains n=1 Tax=Microlunatus soli TaxID=630515 RepID=A0A1H1UT20_9ACTN|nr:WYL domain-containing protein [Microlunatus soli]SDS75692.1 Predicted DNA-binding transcriptional regulator YafY, contains an HTH and WYL domains [Microlunatus soli]